MKLEDTPGPIDWEAAAKLYEERLKEAYKYIDELEDHLSDEEKSWLYRDERARGED